MTDRLCSGGNPFRSLFDGSSVGVPIVGSLCSIFGTSAVVAGTGVAAGVVASGVSAPLAEGFMYQDALLLSRSRCSGFDQLYHRFAATATATAGVALPVSGCTVGVGVSTRTMTSDHDRHPSLCTNLLLFLNEAECRVLEMKRDWAAQALD